MMSRKRFLGLLEGIHSILEIVLMHCRLLLIFIRKMDLRIEDIRKAILKVSACPEIAQSEVRLGFIELDADIDVGFRSLSAGGE